VATSKKARAPIYDAVAQSRFAGRLQGMEEAARVTCQNCGWPAWKKLDGSWVHHVPPGETVECAAPQIRALIDAVVQQVKAC
jgi:hypothetical protein